MAPAVQIAGKLGTGPWSGSFLPWGLLCILELKAGSKSSLTHSLKPFLSITLQSSALGQFPDTCFPMWVIFPSIWLHTPSVRSQVLSNLKNFALSSGWHPALISTAEMGFYISLAILGTFPEGEVINYIGLKLKYYIQILKWFSLYFSTSSLAK